jgi:hypothetical protein
VSLAASSNRNQPGWDVLLPDGKTVQVKYLANGPSGPWVNWHRVQPLARADWYAIVVIVDFAVTGVLTFPNGRLGPIGAALGKRGRMPLEDGWDLSRTSWLSVRDRPDEFRRLGMRVHLPPGLHRVRRHATLARPSTCQWVTVSEPSRPLLPVMASCWSGPWLGAEGLAVPVSASSNRGIRIARHGPDHVAPRSAKMRGGDGGHGFGRGLPRPVPV